MNLQEHILNEIRDPELVFFEHNFGKSYGGQPKYVYEEMLRQGRSFKAVWVYQGKKLEGVPGVIKQVARGTDEYFKYLARAKYWVNNIRFTVTSKPEDTIYLQTWHGSPLKRVGLDIEVSGPETDARDHFLMESAHWDYMLAQNKFASEKFKKAFAVKGKMLPGGYPANDVFYRDDVDTKKEAFYEKHNIPTDKKLILYAPTWRDDARIGKGWNFSFEFQLDLKKMQSELGDEYHLLIRLHHLIIDNLDLTGYGKFVTDVSSIEDTADLLVVTDILITDYSSIFFDFACSKRTMLFFMFDLEKYASELRGFYLDVHKDLPGPIIKDFDTLVDKLKHIDRVDEEYKERMDEFYDVMCGSQDGNASKRVVDEVFADIPVSSLSCSVLMVTYNHENFIYEAILSIFNQTYKFPFELVIADDCSTDDTHREIIRALKEAPDHITVTLQRNVNNLGGVVNFNAAAKLCKGEYIMVADGDDRSLPDRLETLLSHHQKEGRSLYVSNAVHMNEQGVLDDARRYYKDYDLTEIDLTDLYTEKTPIFGASYFFSRSLMLKYGEIDLSLVTHNNVDQNLFWRAWMENGVSYIHEPLLEYRVHTAGCSLRNKEDKVCYSIHILNKLANMVYLDHQVEDSQREVLLPKIKQTLDDLNTQLNAIAKKNRSKPKMSLAINILDRDRIEVNGVAYKAHLKSLKKLGVESFIPTIIHLSQKTPISGSAMKYMVSQFKQKKLNKNELAAFMLLRSKQLKLPYLQGNLSHLFILLVLAARIIKLTKLNRSLDKIS